MKKSLLLVSGAVVGLGTLAVVPSVSADVIGFSINFVGGGTPLPAGQAAGVVPLANWNNEATDPQGNGVVTTPNNSLVDYNDDAVSGLTLGYTAKYNIPGSYGSSTDPGFQDLYSGHLESPYAAPATGTFDPNRVTAYLTGIPYATYDIYVYTRNGNSPGCVYEGTNNASVGPNSIAYTDATQSTYVAGDNYVEFVGLTGSTQYLVASDATNSGGGGFNSGFAGIQVVQAVPEPAALGLLALASLGLGRRRRNA